MKRGFNKGNPGVAGVPQKQGQCTSSSPCIYLIKWHEFDQLTSLFVF